MSDEEVVENKSSRVEDTCTIRAWFNALSKLNELNPSAILSTTHHVLSVEKIHPEIWPKKINYHSDHRCRLTQKEVANELFFNVVLVDKDVDRRKIADALTSLDKETSSNQFESLHELLNSIKDLEPSEQFTCIRRNTRFRDTLYYFPDTREWITHNDMLINRCNGKVYYNFNELFKPDQEANFIHVCRLPYELVLKTILKDPIKDLLKKYESSLN
jgi:hypothetical protein